MKKKEWKALALATESELKAEQRACDTKQELLDLVVEAVTPHLTRPPITNTVAEYVGHAVRLLKEFTSGDGKSEHGAHCSFHRGERVWNCTPDCPSPQRRLKTLQAFVGLCAEQIERFHLGPPPALGGNPLLGILQRMRDAAAGEREPEDVRLLRQRWKLLREKVLKVAAQEASGGIVPSLAVELREAVAGTIDDADVARTRGPS